MKKYLALVLIASCILISGCKGGGSGCDDRPKPEGGYTYFDTYKQGDYESITFVNGSRYITYTTTDNCEWEKSEYTMY